MMAETGTRVGAVLSASDGVVKYLGDGTYLGELQPPVGPYGMSREEVVALWERAGHPMEHILEALSNPCIRLDNGDHVWGFQCWWGPLDEIRKRFDGWEFTDAKLDTYYEPVDV